MQLPIYLLYTCTQHNAQLPTYLFYICIHYQAQLPIYLLLVNLQLDFNYCQPHKITQYDQTLS